MSSRGRGRTPSYRGGRGGRGFPPIQYGNRRLIDSDISGLSLLRQLENDPESLKKVQDMLKSNNSEEGSSSSYANILAESDDNESFERKSSTQEIIILEDRDLQWRDEPWELVQRYLGISSYQTGTYKTRLSYESILKASQSVEIRHFMPNTQAKVYNFSKIIIKHIISIEEWGLNPQAEKEFITQNIPVKYNFWDYKEALYKTFLYQNPQRKHTWFIKICSHVYKKKLPNWLQDWWLIYGAKEEILPEKFLELFLEWKKVSPAIIEAEYNNNFSHNMAIIHFFVEFSIPWIWRWEPEVSHTQENVPVLKRITFVKFWKKMMSKNAEGIIEAQDTINLIQNKISEYKERICNKQQRESFNPFDILEKRISTQNLSKKEQFAKFMKDAKEAILNKLGTDEEMNEGSSSKFEESQDPYDLDDDNSMAEWYASLYSKTKMASDSESNQVIEEEENEENEDSEEYRRGSKKKKSRGKKK